MRFLADAGISPRTVDFLRREAHDVAHVRERGLQRARDRELVRVAHAERRIIVTFDLDFGEILALASADGPSVVLLRLVDEGADAVNTKLVASLGLAVLTIVRKPLFGWKMQSDGSEFGSPDG